MDVHGGGGRRRTPHGWWAAGAGLLLAAIFAAATRPGPPTSRSPLPEAPLRGVPPPPGVEGRPGRIVCGYCNGDGVLGAADLARQAPRLELREGPCAACDGRGGR